MISLDELQQQWRNLDQKLDRVLALEADFMRRVVMQPVRRRVNRLAIWPAIDVAGCVGVLLWCGSFLSRHWADGGLALCALVLMAGAVALLISSIRLLDRVFALVWSGPVAAIQESLARIRSTRIRQFQGIILFAPLVGFCALVVGLQWLIDRGAGEGVNILEKLDSRWVIANLIFGVLFVPAGALLARQLARRFQHHPWWQGVLDGISGTTLQSASREIEQWVRLHQTATGPTD